MRAAISDTVLLFSRRFTMWISAQSMIVVIRLREHLFIPCMLKDDGSFIKPGTGFKHCAVMQQDVLAAVVNCAGWRTKRQVAKAGSCTMLLREVPFRLNRMYI